mgnify:CR=1 FL=1
MGNVAVQLLDFLLVAPDLHDQLVGQEFNQCHLQFGVLAVDGHVLAAFHVADGLLNNVCGLVHEVVIGDGPSWLCRRTRS